MRSAFLHIPYMSIILLIASLILNGNLDIRIVLSFLIANHKQLSHKYSKSILEESNLLRT